MARLVVFLHQLVATGVARNAIAIARHMHAAGWDTSLVTVRDGGELAGAAPEVRHVALGGRARSRRHDLALSIPRLRETLRQLAPDIVLSAGNHAHFALLAAACGSARYRRIYRFSNDLAHAATPGSLRSRLSSRRLTARLVARDADAIVLVSPDLANDRILKPHVQTGKARIIPNGVDVEVVRLRAAVPCDGLEGAAVPIVLGVGRLVRQKNFARLIEAFALARAERPLSLAIVGGGKRRARAALEEHAAKLGVARDVNFVGRVSNPFPFFRAASVVVIPSLWEGSPNVLLEALACGTPLVASRTAGNAASLLDEGRFGVLIDPYDVSAMAQAILAQLDPSSAILPGDRAFEFDRSLTLLAYQALFEETLAAR
ncbi:glycosyltransferase [Novosphingobium sp. M1R2S20]|uniref:Glycosyltransferase n=1 Tax=Novosphingobium rhizovicinum TaxID=3228928 RepID=A0ABV3R9B2_9SPHN